jgi:hypothetical protein
MTVQYHFVCATPKCRKHVHVTIICHDEQKCDLDKLGEAVGFRQSRDQAVFTTITANNWHCEEHVS